MPRANISIPIAIALVGLTFISALLHVIRISEPPLLVEDEPHFATYASDYASRTGFYDIHPPLGRLILGASARLSGVTSAYPFIKLMPWSYGRMYERYVLMVPPGDFPYKNLRLTVAIFGTLIPFSVFLLLLALRSSQGTALLGAFFVTFENMLLLHSRLIMLDAFMIVFGITGLASFSYETALRKKVAPGRYYLLQAPCYWELPVP